MEIVGEILFISNLNILSMPSKKKGKGNRNPGASASHPDPAPVPASVSTTASTPAITGKQDPEPFTITENELRKATMDAVVSRLAELKIDLTTEQEVSLDVMINQGGARAGLLVCWRFRSPFFLFLHFPFA